VICRFDDFSLPAIVRFWSAASCIQAARSLLRVFRVAPPPKVRSAGWANDESVIAC
jgi:hypothetical protein